MLSVIQAIYASNRQGRDVTGIAQTVLASGAPLKIENGTFGFDPDLGATKYFALQYRLPDAGPFFMAAEEGQIIGPLVLPPDAGDERSSAAPPVPARGTRSKSPRT